VRIANVRGRAVIVTGTGTAMDIGTASGRRFGPDLADLYENWTNFTQWASQAVLTSDTSFVDDEVGPPAPRPRQVFAVGLNYADHADEGGIAVPEEPMIFTKFPACISGPYDDIPLHSHTVDYEAELVGVIGRVAKHVDTADAWEYLAGLTCGQDISDRRLQVTGPAPQQFSLAKSFTGFGPIGPWLVTRDEFAAELDIEVRGSLNGEVMQSERTKTMLYPLPRIIAYLSSILTLWPGDLIFTGTPAGVGWVRNPRITLTPGDLVTTEIEGIGVMRNRCVEGHGTAARINSDA
jgi:2-keto-4-pentenoate hydratase/2-oxohepta-3-ene-1,7-dioic acid hydratase in catechol pathway